MPQKRPKTNHTKKHKNSNPNLNGWICAFLENICKNDQDLSNIAEVVKSRMLSKNQLKGMIKTSWSHLNIEQKKIDYFIDTLLIFLQRKNKNQKKNSIAAHAIHDLLQMSLEQKYCEYTNQCIKWCIEFMHSINSFTGISIVSLCHEVKILYVLKYETHLKTNDAILKCRSGFLRYLEFIAELLKNHLIPQSFIYQQIIDKIFVKTNKISPFGVESVCNLKNESAKQFNKYLNVLESISVQIESEEYKMLIEEVLSMRHNNNIINNHDNENDEQILGKELVQLKSEIQSMQQKCNNLEIKCESQSETLKINSNKFNNALQLKHKEINKLNVMYKDLQKKCASNEEKLKQKCAKQKIKIQSLQHQNNSLENSKQKLNQMQRKYNNIKVSFDELQIAHKELNTKYNKQYQKFSYLSWNSTEIANWILNIDTLRYAKYYQNLVNNMDNECVDGECLHDLTTTDLHRFGIIHFKDKQDVLTAIYQLVFTNNGVNNNKQILMKGHKDAKCVICLDDIPTYACVPCGHLNVCSKCKNKLNGICPICQNHYDSLIKIFHDFQ